jgi:hypothetical protein
MACPPATSEAEARWPRFGLVVVATTSRRDYLDQMIRPLVFIKQLVGAIFRHPKLISTNYYRRAMARKL